MRDTAAKVGGSVGLRGVHAAPETHRRPELPRNADVPISCDSRGVDATFRARALLYESESSCDVGRVRWLTGSRWQCSLCLHKMFRWMMQRRHTLGF